LAELRGVVGKIKHETKDVDLIGAINDLENLLEPRRVRGDGGEAYIAALNSRFDEIHEALLALDGLRKR
jgi:hypothetical protein